VTELCSGKALGDADNDADNDAADTDAADTADKSNPYMSPFQGDTKIQDNNLFNFLICSQIHTQQSFLSI
jgi:hypothetical protein